MPVELDVTDAPLEREPRRRCVLHRLGVLTNVAKYAEATRAAVRVRETGDRLVVVVEDDGAAARNPYAGTGLLGLGDRVMALDGEMFVDSPEGGGTRIRAELPLAWS